jgi:cell division protein FtsQ
MKNYNQLVRELDSSGARYSQELSEVDLSDPEDVKVLAADSNGQVLVHLGSGNYLQRYRTYVTHAQQWRQQFEKLDSVDLRYDGQIIVNPDLEGMARQPSLTPAAAKAAVAAGVKTAAIVNYEKYVTHPVSASPAKPIATKKDSKAKVKAGTKPGIRHVSAKSISAKPVAAKSGPAKPNAVSQTPPKPNGSTSSVATAKNAGTPPAVSLAQPTATTGQKKPSAVIPKESSPN